MDSENDSVIFSKKDILELYDISLLMSDNLKDKLVSVISVGSARKTYIEGWSDIDLLLILKDCDYSTKRDVRDFKESYQKNTGVKVGIDIVSQKELKYVNHSPPIIRGKVLQGLYELERDFERCIYGDQQTSIHIDDGVIQEMSLNEIFFLRNMMVKNIISSDPNINESMAMKQIKVSFIITKLALQYSFGGLRIGYKSIVKNAKEKYPQFDFSQLDKNLGYISNWVSMNSIDYGKISEENDDYSEDFINFFTKKVLLYPTSL